MRRRLLCESLNAPVVRLPVAGLLSTTFALAAFGQDTGAAGTAGRTLSFFPTFSASETYTDNRLLTASDRQSDLISQFSPGLHLGSASGRVRGSLDYSLNGFFYARGASQNNLQNQLNGTLNAELLENRAFVDATATITQQSISAFGTQSPDIALTNANRSEVGSYTVSPYFRGSLGGLASYEARVSYQILHSDGFAAGNSRTNGASLDLHSDPSASSRLGWRIAYTHQGLASGEARSTASDRENATLSFSATPELVFTASGGHEASDVSTPAKQGTRTWGVGLDWRPSERTRLNLSRDKRVFGDSHAALIEYRTARTVWRFSDTQDVSVPATTATGSTPTAYDLLFAQYASQFPDPVQRSQFVNSLLASTGISRGALVGGGFLSAASSLQRRQDFSVALSGLRTTTLLSAYQTRTSNLDPLAPAVGDLAAGGAVHQRGFGATVSHRLTPESSANLNVSLLRSTADTSGLATNQRVLTLTWSTRFGPHVNVSLTGRHTLFASTTQPYVESGLIGGLNVNF